MSVPSFHSIYHAPDVLSAGVTVWSKTDEIPALI